MSARSSAYCAGCLVAVLGALGRPAAGQPAAHHQQLIATIPSELLQRPLPLRTGIGRSHEAVSTGVAAAQSYYDQGLALLHSYVWIDAARSFNQSIRLDPNCAMAYMGLSYALSGVGVSVGALEANRQADALAPRVSARERLRIALREQQLQTIAHPEDGSLMVAYKKALDQALQQYRSDVELLLLRGHAEDSSAAGYGMTGGEAAIAFYERALALSPDYFAAHHYLTHAYENANRIDRALEHGQAYARLAPAVAHAHHMYGHNLRRVGRMLDAVAEFRNANDLDVRSLKEDDIPPEYNWSYHHNLDLLGTSYQYLGRTTLAGEVLRRSFELPALSLTAQLNKRAWPLFLIACGRTNEALEAARLLASHDLPLVRAMGHMLAARALMVMRRLADAGSEADAALSELRGAGPGADALAADLRVLQGEFFLRSGDRERGRTMLRRGIAELRSDSDPDLWIHTLFALEAIGNAAREVADWTLVSEVTTEMRRHDPGYGGTQFAIGLAAEQQGDTAVARAAYAEAARLWRDADADFAELRDVRRRLAALAALDDRKR